MRNFLAALSFLLVSTFSFAAANANNVLSLNTASTNITTSAYVAITATGGTPIPTSQFSVWNGTSTIVVLAYGASGSETQLFACGPTTQCTFDTNWLIPAATRLSLITLDATASTKYVVVSVLP
jgi:hypothetical protein